MARATLAQLISECRSLVGDPSGGSAHYTDDQIESALDRRRKEARRCPLRARSDMTPTGVSYTVFYAPIGIWESDALLLDSSWQVIDNAYCETIDYLRGRWEFKTSTLPPLYLRGYYYDLHGACADLLDQWMADLKAAYDFSSGDQSFRRSQQLQSLASLAQQYRSQAWVVSADSVRVGDNAY